MNSVFPRSRCIGRGRLWDTGCVPYDKLAVFGHNFQPPLNLAPYREFGPTDNNLIHSPYFRNYETTFSNS
jgi:hypothetical protein